MRAILVIDANSEEIVFSKRFPTIEQRLKQFYQAQQIQVISEKQCNFNKKYEYLYNIEYAPMPDNGIFKLAFSRQVIQKQKLEQEKKKLPHLHDYKLDSEEWPNMMEGIRNQFQNDVPKKSNENAHLYRNPGGIMSLKLNLSHSTIGELWPVLYYYQKNLYYVIAVVSMLEDENLTIFNPQPQQFSEQDISQMNKSQFVQSIKLDKEEIKLQIEERSQNIILIYEYLQKISQILKLNQSQHNMLIYEWIQILVDMSAPFGTIHTTDLAGIFQQIKASTNSQFLQDTQSTSLKQEEQDILDLINSLTPIKASQITKQNEWEPHYKYQLAKGELTFPSPRVVQTLSSLDILSYELLQPTYSSFQNSQEQLYIFNQESLTFIQYSTNIDKSNSQTTIDQQSFGLVEGSLQCLAQFTSPCEISFSLSSKRDLHNPQTMAKCKLEEVDPGQQKIKNAKLIFKALPNEWVQLLSYQIPIRINDGVLPLTCKYSFKQISQSETKIWIKIQLHSQLQARSLRILIPIFNMSNLGLVNIKCSLGKVSKIMHPQGFPCLIWSIVDHSQSTFSLLTLDKHELQGSIFSPSEQDSQVLLEDHYDPQYEDILLKSNEELLQQNYQELTVESSENYNLIDKESLNIQDHFEELKKRMHEFSEDEFFGRQLKFTPLDAMGQISGIMFHMGNGSSSGNAQVGGDYDVDQEKITYGVEKRPQLVDKECYIKVEFIGKIGGKLVGQIDINKVMFYPHRDGIQVKVNEEIKTHKYIIWNSLAENDIS